MNYDAIVSRDGDSFLIEFPDCVGCQTFADSADEVVATATEALEGWLETTLAERRVPPRPTKHKAPLGSSLLRVTVNPMLSVALQVRLQRQERNMSQAALAELVGVSQQAVAKLEDPDANPTLETVQKAAKALGLKVTLTLDSIKTFPKESTMRSAAESIPESRPAPHKRGVRRRSDVPHKSARGKARA